MELRERDGVLDALVAHLRAATGARGSGRIALLAGESGAGKTAVARRLTELTQAHGPGGVRILQGACDHLSIPRPLGAIRDIADELGPGRLREAAHARGDPAQVPELLLSELRGPDAHPILLIVEDAHWADQATLDVLHHLARRIETTRALVLITYREEGVSRGHPLTVFLGDLAGLPAVHRLTLRPLSRSAVAALAAEAGTGADPDEIHRRTGGNPFYVTEVLAAGARGVPDTVRAAVLARRARLGPEARRALDTLAVAGPRTTLALATALLGQELPGVDECLESGVLDEESGHPDRLIVFRHELARSAVAAAVPVARRRLTHRRALAALTADADARNPDEVDPQPLAEHAEGAGDAAAVLHWAPLAARHAAALRSHREAADHYARALRFAAPARTPPEQRAELLEQLSFERYLTSRLTEALDACRRALTLRQQAGDDLATAATLRWTARLEWSDGRPAEARRAAREAAALLETGPPSAELGWSWATLAQLAAYGQDPQTALPWAERAIALGREHGDPALVLHARTSAALARLLRSEQDWEHDKETDEAWSELADTVDTAAATGAEEHAANGWSTAACVAVLHHDHRRAEVALSGGIAYCEAHDLGSFGWFLQAVTAMYRLHRGRWDEAEQTALAVLRRTGRTAPMHRLQALCVLGLLRARRGEEEGEVWRPLDEALACTEPEDLLRLGQIREARAEAAWLAGDQTRARAEAAAGLATAGEHCDPWLTAGLARWYVRTGTPAPRERAAPGPLRYELARDWSGAQRAWQRLGCPYEAALAGVEAAVSAGPAARSPSDALAVLRALGADAAVRRSLERLRAAGAPAPRGPYAATRRNPEGLTPRQNQVLELLRKGLPDAAIADELWISRKTASHHVAAVLAKLGVRSRRELLGSRGAKDG